MHVIQRVAGATWRGTPSGRMPLSLSVERVDHRVPARGGEIHEAAA
jgi:hypothetical protein